MMLEGGGWDDGGDGGVVVLSMLGVGRWSLLLSDNVGWWGPSLLSLSGDGGGGVVIVLVVAVAI